MGIRELLKKNKVFIIGVALVTLAVILALWFVSSRMQEGTSVEATGQNNLRYSIYYIENELFEENPIPQNLSYIKLFTDYIKIESSFNADFGQEFDIAYKYTARQRFSVYYTGGAGPNSLVYQREDELDKVSGRITAEKLEFIDGSDGKPGGVFLIKPDDYLGMYEEFLQYYDSQMGGESTATTRGFTAELTIEFTYSVVAMPIGIQETTTRGLKIPILQDVFTIETYGQQGFNAVAEVHHDIKGVSPVVVLAWLLALAAGTLMVVVGIMRYKASIKTNSQRQLVNKIVKSYSGEIIMSASPIDITGLRPVTVEKFDELLKLSINLNKHIMCYKNNKRAEFYTVVDEFVYCFKASYDANMSEPSTYDEIIDVDNEVTERLFIDSEKVKEAFESMQKRRGIK